MGDIQNLEGTSYIHRRIHFQTKLHTFKTADHKPVFTSVNLQLHMIIRSWLAW
jgi:hypothetical protein